MLVERFHKNLAKSTGKLPLYEHAIGSTMVAHHIIKKFASSSYPLEKVDQLLFSTFIHDLGKLDPDFQTMLQAAAAGEPLSGKRVKHEAGTFDFSDLLREDKDEVIDVLRSEIGHCISTSIDLEIALAFAVTHHGLFYMAYESTKNWGDRWLIRREWTSTTANEIKRITLVDLLFTYHPFGGLVIVSDLIHSFCHENGLDYRDVLRRADSYRDLVIMLVEKKDQFNQCVELWEGRNKQGLRELLLLLLGGIAS